MDSEDESRDGFFRMGVMVALLKEEGNMPVVSEKLKRWVRAGIIAVVRLRWDGIESRGQVVR